MVKTLIPIGDGLGLVFDRSILDQLRIDLDTEFEITIEDNGNFLRPVAHGVQERFLEAAKQMMEIHQSTFRKLAE